MAMAPKKMRGGGMVKKMRGGGMVKKSRRRRRRCVKNDCISRKRISSRKRIRSELRKEAKEKGYKLVKA
jgi:hypothetical protein